MNVSGHPPCHAAAPGRDVLRLSAATCVRTLSPRWPISSDRPNSKPLLGCASPHPTANLTGFNAVAAAVTSVRRSTIWELGKDVNFLPVAPLASRCNTRPGQASSCCWPLMAVTNPVRTFVSHAMAHDEGRACIAHLRCDACSSDPACSRSVCGPHDNGVFEARFARQVSQARVLLLHHLCGGLPLMTAARSAAARCNAVALLAFPARSSSS